MAARADFSGSATLASDYRLRGVSLSNEHASGQADLNFDGGGGWYAGAFFANVRLGAPPGPMIQWLPYAGVSRRLDTDTTVDLGVEYSGFTGGNDYGYFEAHGGITWKDLSARLFLSPDYFGSGARTLYGQVDGSRPVNDFLRLFAHLGALQFLSGVPGDPNPTRHPIDFRAGLQARWSRVTAQLSWVTVSQVADAYPVGNYDGISHSSRSAWVFQLSVSN